MCCIFYFSPLRMDRGVWSSKEHFACFSTAEIRPYITLPTMQLVSFIWNNLQTRFDMRLYFNVKTAFQHVIHNLFACSVSHLFKIKHKLWTVLSLLRFFFPISRKKVVNNRERERETAATEQSQTLEKYSRTINNTVKLGFVYDEQSKYTGFNLHPLSSQWVWTSMQTSWWKSFLSGERSKVKLGRVCVCLPQIIINSFCPDRSPEWMRRGGR